MSILFSLISLITIKFFKIIKRVYDNRDIRTNLNAEPVSHAWNYAHLVPKKPISAYSVT